MSDIGQELQGSTLTMERIEKSFLPCKDLATMLKTCVQALSGPNHTRRPRLSSTAAMANHLNKPDIRQGDSQRPHPQQHVSSSKWPQAAINEVEGL